ncbi:MAG TPA: dihydropteroate synthase, partial [Bacteroidales bacterium]|nr:dihydropteroate synthase [Bacteroidales bacterium]
EKMLADGADIIDVGCVSTAPGVIYRQAKGADIIDVGCVSTRPGSRPITAKDETAQAVKVLTSLRKSFPEIIISVDTYRADVARASADAGADIINDISGGMMDVNMFPTVAELHIPYILMHMQGTPETMQMKPSYTDVTKEILFFLSEKVCLLKRMGVNDIIIDPGFGFGKTIEQNFHLLKDIDFFKFLSHPLLIGVSRKSMIWKVLKSSPEKALNGTSVLNTYALLKKAGIIRVHDVKEARECVELINFLSV